MFAKSPKPILLGMLFLLLASSVFLFSCSRSSAGYAEFSRSAPPGGEAPMQLSENKRAVDAFAPESPVTSTTRETTSAIPSSRKLIKTGEVSLETREINQAEAEATALTIKLGGYVASTSNSGDYVYMTLRIPQQSFESAMTGLVAIGKLSTRSEQVADVTMQFVDLESRITTKKILRERYTEYLRRSENVEDLLAVERALNEVIAELDAMEASFKTLSDQIDYATINVTISLPPEAKPASQRSFIAGLLKVWDSFVGFVFIVLYSIIIILIFGVPLIALAGLCYWLGFGRIGLIRKFFSLLSEKNKQ